MKVTLASLAFLFITVLSANAQETKTMDQDNTVQNNTDRMARDLNLNDSQKARLHMSNTTYYNNTRQMNDANQNAADNERMSRQYQDTYDRDMRDILDDDQYTRFESSRDQYRMQPGTQGSQQMNNNTGSEGTRQGAEKQMRSTSPR